MKKQGLCIEWRMEIVDIPYLQAKKQKDATLLQKKKKKDAIQ